MTLKAAKALAEAREQLHDATTEEEREAALAAYVKADRELLIRMGVDVPQGSAISRFLPLALIFLLVILAFLSVGNSQKTASLARDTAGLAEATATLSHENQQRIAAGRQALLDGCRRSNKNLRLTINRNIVRPLNDALSAAASSVPVYNQILGELKTVPYAICANAYPLHGEPHPPYFREAPLPKPITVAGTGSASTPPVAAPQTTSPSTTPAPPSGGSAPSTGSTGPQGPAGPQGPQGGGGHTTPGPGAPPPQTPTVLDQVCGALPLNLC